MNFIRISALLILFTLIAGCSDRIKEDKFILVYSDLWIAKDTTQGNPNQDKIKNSVFTKYGVTSKEYDATLNYYNSDPRKWEPFFTKTIAHLEGLRSKKLK